LNRYLALAFALLMSFVITAFLVSPKTAGNSPLVQSDRLAFLAIDNSHYEPLNQLMILLTEYGREVVWIASGVLIFIFGGWSGRKAAIIMAISMLVLIPVGTLAKDVVERPRPAVPQSDFLLAADSDYSFPSGHAVIVSAGAASLLAIFRDSRSKVAISVALAVEAALVCISRVYVGGHYPLDVVGGILLGVGTTFIFISISKTIEVLFRPFAKILKR
jgi:undecaprenyl-diphosphatase